MKNFFYKLIPNIFDMTALKIFACLAKKRKSLLCKGLIPVVLTVFFIISLTETAFSENVSLAGKKELIVKRSLTKDAVECIECHAKKTSGIVESWKSGKMAHAGISCIDCHYVEKNSPMASQCGGLKGSEKYISAMVSSKTCSRCHPEETDEFLKSAHSNPSRKAVFENEEMVKLQLHYEGGEFIGNKINSPLNRASRASGCQLCHGSVVEMGPDNKPANETWPAGVGTLYPDGSVGTCTVCHTRHGFSITEARKPEACGNCHVGPDHPDIEIYFASKHGQVFLTDGDKWRWDSAPDTWEPGDYAAPTCAVCHISGIGALETTHNVSERLKWDLVHKKSVIRSGVKGDGEKGDMLMRQVCSNCHGITHTDNIMKKRDNAVGLYNQYWDNAVKMETELKNRGLLKQDPWKDGFQELMYFLWHHTGRRARHGAAMNAPDYAHWHGFFQIFQVYKDMEDIYNWRIKNNKIEELSSVMSGGPF